MEPGDYELVCLPLKWVGAEGAPARAILRRGGEEREGRGGISRHQTLGVLTRSAGAAVEQPRRREAADASGGRLRDGSRDCLVHLLERRPEAPTIWSSATKALAEVVEAGPEARDLQPGDLVVPTVRRPCDDPACIACRNDRSDFCMTGLYREHGICNMHGFMTEFVVDEARYMRKVPPAIRDAAVLVEPLTIAEKAFIQAEQILMRLPWNSAGTPGAAHQAVVLGAGPVGLLGPWRCGCAAARSRFIRASARRTRAPKFRAPSARNMFPRWTARRSRWRPAIGNIDLVYEATGSPKLAFDMIHVLGRNGVLILTGVPGAHGHAGHRYRHAHYQYDAEKSVPAGHRQCGQRRFRPRYRRSRRSVRDGRTR